jgi:hypothetical protein
MSIGRVRSVRDIPYEIKPDTSYHPALIDSAIQRIRQTKIGERLSEALGYCVSDKVWAVIVEDEGRPLYIAQNLAHSKTAVHYRRVLCVPFNGTSDLV